MYKNIHVIINATAGAYLISRKLGKVKEYLKQFGGKLQFNLTKYSRHAKELAKTAVAAHADLIISIGGDGTFNEIINGMMECNQPPEALPVIGIISAGTGADLCRSLNIPMEYEQAIEIIMKGRTMKMDLGMVVFKNQEKCWHRYFANVFDVGLGGNVVRIANHIPKSLGGFMTFLLSSLAGIMTCKPLELEIYIDGRFFDQGKITIIGATNGKYFGGGMKIAPMASINDGFLEILYVKDTNLFKFIKNVLMPVYEARHLLYRNLYHCKARYLEIKSRRVFLTDIDGEEEKAQEVKVSIKQSAIRVVVPT